jgi:hypothetical protein
VPRVEEIVYEAGRTALADQDAVVTGIRQRTGTLLAAHALVASFLGATTVKAKGLHGFSWWAVAALVLGLAVAAILLSPWKLRFAIDAPNLEIADDTWSCSPSSETTSAAAFGTLATGTATARSLCQT